MYIIRGHAIYPVNSRYEFLRSDAAIAVEGNSTTLDISGDNLLR